MSMLTFSRDRRFQDTGTQGSSVRGSRRSRREWQQTSFLSRDSEAACGSERATRGGSFWTRIRLGKAVAAPGVRSQDGRKRGKKSVIRGGSFWIRIRCKKGKKSLLFDLVIYL